MRAQVRPRRSVSSIPASAAPALSQAGIREQGPSLFKGCLGRSLDANCIEKLLLHCGAALEKKDSTLAQQIMWVLNNIASSDGDPNQRLTSWFLRSLITRASRVCPVAMNLQRCSLGGVHLRSLGRPMSVTELAGYVDLLPWHRFGFSASNSAISNAIQGHPKVHILDFSITHCMQWPTLIDELSRKPGAAPFVRLSVPSVRPKVPPWLNVSCEQVGQRLANFAKSRNVPFAFRVIPIGDSITEVGTEPYHESIINNISVCALGLAADEILVVNCQNFLHYLPDEVGDPLSTKNQSPRDRFLELIRGLNPKIVTVVDEDSNLGSLGLSSRISTCFNYLWILFDALETFLPRDSTQRLDYEADIGYKIENIIAFEGLQRIERLEPSGELVQRMRRAHFHSVPFGEETLAEVKCLLGEHASGWGMKKEDDTWVLTWKGHNAVFASAWGCS
ncbi:Scarecrow-like protein 32 [Nymphaea thermarum]|nr:Scarecrow-like protein 32 [Nymphaea thermarum]